MKETLGCSFYHNNCNKMHIFLQKRDESGEAWDKSDIDTQSVWLMILWCTLHDVSPHFSHTAFESNARKRISSKWKWIM